jgi:hypothetical protein
LGLDFCLFPPEHFFRRRGGIRLLPMPPRLREKCAPSSGAAQPSSLFGFAGKCGMEGFASVTK